MFIRIFTRTVSVILIIAAASVLMAYELFPVVRVYGSSMEPAVKEGDILILLKTENIEAGDIAAYCYGNKILIRRCIAGPEDVVDMDQEGTIYVNGSALNEDKSFIQKIPTEQSEEISGSKSDSETGAEPDCLRGDQEYPLCVLEENYFFIADSREKAMDSRYREMGTIRKADVIGKVLIQL